MKLINLLVLLLLTVGEVFPFGGNPEKQQTAKPIITNRRIFLSIAATASVSPPAFLSLTATTNPPVASAFENCLDGALQTTEPKVGKQPDDIGVKTRSTSTTKSDYIGLANCDGRLNCWTSSTPNSRYIEPWQSPKGARSLADLKKVIETYEVGQQGIDGGGFRIVQYDTNQNYLYARFQSYKKGYIDDVEFWWNPDKGRFDVRSASRLGKSDLGVNAKRLEYIGNRLENEFGWPLERRKNGSLVR